MLDNKVLQFIELDVKICRQQCPHNNHNSALPFLSLKFFSLRGCFKTFSLLSFIFSFISLLPLYKYLSRLVGGNNFGMCPRTCCTHTFFAINLKKKKKKKKVLFTWTSHINCCSCCVIWTCLFCSVTLKIPLAKLAEVSVTIIHFNKNLLIYNYIQAVTIH